MHRLAEMRANIVLAVFIGLVMGFGSVQFSADIINVDSICAEMVLDEYSVDCRSMHSYAYFSSFLALFCLLLSILVGYCSRVSRLLFATICAMGAICCSILSWFVVSLAFTAFMIFVRILACIWLLYQNLVVLDIVHHVHTALLGSSLIQSPVMRVPNRIHHCIHTILVVVIIYSGAMLVTNIYTVDVGCEYRNVLQVLSCIYAAVTTFASMLPRCNKGLLTPTLNWLYTQSLLQYAYSSDPRSNCSSSAGNTINIRVCMMVIFVISLVHGLLYWSSTPSMILDFIRYRLQQSDYNHRDVDSAHDLTPSLPVNHQTLASPSSGLLSRHHHHSSSTSSPSSSRVRVNSLHGGTENEATHLLYAHAHSHPERSNTRNTCNDNSATDSSPSAATASLTISMMGFNRTRSDVYWDEILTGQRQHSSDSSISPICTWLSCECRPLSVQKSTTASTAEISLDSCPRRLILALVTLLWMLVWPDAHKNINHTDRSVGVDSAGKSAAHASHSSEDRDARMCARDETGDDALSYRACFLLLAAAVCYANMLVSDWRGLTGAHSKAVSARVYWLVDTTKHCVSMAINGNIKIMQF